MVSLTENEAKTPYLEDMLEGQFRFKALIKGGT
jgi:hypothetical protein